MSPADPGGAGTMRVAWSAVLDDARELVATYTQQVTLRQLYYRLVSTGAIPNSAAAYKHLSAKTAAARRAGQFPDLVDRGREITRPFAFTSTEQARNWLADTYRRNRTEGQPFAVWIVLEKDAIAALLSNWFGEPLGLPVVALRGYGSQSIADLVRRDIAHDRRPAICLYAGDHDPSGVDIERDFLARTDCWHTHRRIALTADQVIEHQLPPMPGKATDSRAVRFTAEHGRLVQVEVDALDPTVLRQMFTDAITPWWSTTAYQAVLDAETADRDELR